MYLQDFKRIGRSGKYLQSQTLKSLKHNLCSRVNRTHARTDDAGVTVELKSSTLRISRMHYWTSNSGRYSKCIVS
jgi:hypothetical protein